MRANYPTQIHPAWLNRDDPGRCRHAERRPDIQGEFSAKHISSQACRAACSACVNTQERGHHTDRWWSSGTCWSYRLCAIPGRVPAFVVGSRSRLLQPRLGRFICGRGLELVEGPCKFGLVAVVVASLDSGLNSVDRWCRRQLRGTNGFWSASARPSEGGNVGERPRNAGYKTASAPAWWIDVQQPSMHLWWWRSAAD